MSITPLGRETEAIQEMLLDAGLEGAVDLRSSLEELRAHSLEAAPEPRAELAALLGAGGPAGIAQDPPSLAQRRWSRRRRMAVVGASLTAAMSLGAGAVAAYDDDFRRGVSEISLTVGRIFSPPDQKPGQQQDQEAPPASVPAVQVPSPTSSASPSTTEQAVRQPPVVPAPSAPPPAAPAQGGDHAPLPSGLPTELPVVPGSTSGNGLPESPLPEVPTLPAAIPTELGG